MKQLHILILSIFVLCLSGNLYSQHSPKAREIVILHTNDMHAKIDNMAKLAFLADSLRKCHKYVFLVAAGDNFTGNPVVDMVEDKGYPMIDLMNSCGFNLSALGNHEFDLGQEKLNARVAQANFPFISCNIDAGGAVFRQPDPFHILKAGRNRIPVLAIIQLGENGLPDSHPSRLAGLKFNEGIEKAKEYAWLKEKYGSLIALTHLGVEGDEPLAKAMLQLDLIIGGHSHTTLTKPMVVGGVPIVQTGSGLKNAGMTTLWINKGKIEEITYKLIPLSSVKGEVAEVRAKIDKFNDNKELNRSVGLAEETIRGEAELGSLMCDAVAAQLKLDFVFQNVGGIRISSIEKGEISLKDIYKLDPFGNQVVVYKMNSAEIGSLLMNSYNRGKEIDMEASGMKYTILTGPDGSCTGIEMSGPDGNPLDTAKEYSVGVNSYIAATYKFDHRDEGTTTYTTTAQALIDYLGLVKKVNYSGVKRAFVRPEN